MCLTYSDTYNMQNNLKNVTFFQHVKLKPEHLARGRLFLSVGGPVLR